MKYEKFKIVNMVKEFILNLDKNLTNFPKKQIELKREIMESAYNLLLIVYEGNVASSQERRMILQEKAIANLKYIDFLLNVCYEKEIINGKKYLKFGEKIENMVRYIVAWRNATTGKSGQQTRA